MLLSDVIKKNNNNLDLFRIICASIVIYGHSFVMVRDAHGSDLIAKILPYDYSGSFAVKVFFFISGLVVTNSLLTNNNINHFIKSRIFRIMPGLIFFCFTSAFIILPFFYDGSIIDYYRNSGLYNYIVHNSLLITEYRISGVFGNADNHTSVINGSIWTIPYEMLAYFILLSAYSVNLLNKKYLASIAFVIVIISCLFQQDGFLVFNEGPMERSMLSYCFSCGVIFCVYKDQIKVKFTHAIALLVIYILLSKTHVAPFIFYLTFFYCLIYICSRKLILKLKPKHDISYGIYIWGWPVQQMVSKLEPSLGIYSNSIISILIAMAFGLISWLLIERRFINIGRSMA